MLFNEQPVACCWCSGELEADADGRDGVLLPRALRRLLEEAAAGFAPAEGRGEHDGQRV